MKINALKVHKSLSGWGVKTSVDSIDLFNGSKEIRIENGYEEYTLKINDHDELELILNTSRLH